MDEAAFYINSLMKLRNWLPADLARACDKPNSTITRILSGERKVGADMALIFAEVFKVDPVVVFRKVGLLPPAPDVNEQIQNAVHLLSQLPPSEVDELMAIASLKLNKRINTSHANKSREKPPAQSLLKAK